MKEKFPSTYIIQITNTCMAKCYQCDFWGNKKPVNELNSKEKLNLIAEILRLKGSTAPYIHFTGGEPFLKKDEILELADYCRQKKIPCGIDSTGYFMDEDIARKLSETTLNVHISLDSITPAIHDEMRRLEYCHQKALSAIDNLIKYLGNQRVFIRTVISKKNLDEIDKLIKYADEKKIGIEFVTLMCDDDEKSTFLRKEYWPDNKRKIDEALGTIQKMTKQGYNCLITKNKLSDYKHYFYKGTTRKKCNYYKNTLFIDCLGDIRLCCFTEALGNIRENSLKDIYTSEKAEKIKKKLEHCKITNCNLPLCQDYSIGLMQYLKRFFQYSLRSFFLYKLKFFFVYIIMTPDRLIGIFGAFLNKHDPDLYAKLRKTKGGK